MDGGGSSVLISRSNTHRMIHLSTTQITWPTTVMMASRMNSTNRMNIKSMRLQTLSQAGDTNHHSGIQTTPNTPKQQ